MGAKMMDKLFADATPASGIEVNVSNANIQTKDLILAELRQPERLQSVLDLANRYGVMDKLLSGKDRSPRNASGQESSGCR